jgi:hypothetical protein
LNTTLLSISSSLHQISPHPFTHWPDFLLQPLPEILNFSLSHMPFLLQLLFEFFIR